MPSETKSEGSKSQGRGRSNSLPAHVVEYLKAWLMSPEHINHPYPTEQEKTQMVEDTGIELKRLNNWFVNNRIRYWKPRMEALQRQQRQEESQKNTEGKGSKGLSLAQPSLFDQLSSALREKQRKADQVSTFESTTLSSSSSSVGIVSDASSVANESTDDGNASDVLSVIDTIHLQDKLCMSKDSTSGQKRRLEETTIEAVQSPRSKYSRKNIKLWRKACSTSSRLNDDALPTLDEAACLFGYSSDH